MELIDYPFKTTPLGHQRDEFMKSTLYAAWCLFWEQGTGKTKATIDVASYLAMTDQIDVLLVIAPNGVHLNWLQDEIPAHMPDALRKQTRTFAYRTAKAGTKWFKEALKSFLTWDKGFRVLSVSYDCFMVKDAKLAIWNFIQGKRVMMVADESEAIKNPSAKRSISVLAASKYAVVRRVLNGTPVGNGPFDLYAQVKFVDPDFWTGKEIQGYTEFKQSYGRFVKKENADGKKYDFLIGYRRLNELNSFLSEIGSRVLKEDVLDLPPKIYTKRYFEPTPKQWQHYLNLQDEFMTWLEDNDPDGEIAQWAAGLTQGEEVLVVDAPVAPKPDPLAASHAEQMALALDYEAAMAAGATSVPEASTLFEEDETDLGDGSMVTAPLAIVRMLRMQQVLSGYLPADDTKELHTLDVKNPRLDTLQEVVEDLTGKCIIWAPRFRQDIELIAERLEKLGKTFTCYHGGMSHSARADSANAFKSTDEGTPQFMIASYAASRGHTWVVADTVVYYTNDFKLVHRLQSEDRAHRIGQMKSVRYIDIIAERTIDEHIVRALREKFDIAAQITGDKLREWLK